MTEYAKIEDMIGRTFVEVATAEHDEVLRFVEADGSAFVFYHGQDCCESVSIESIDGALADLVGHPLVQAEEVSSEGADPPEHADSFTWTFYKFSTIRGSVTVRWLGQSNGYYSENVDLRRELP